MKTVSIYALINPIKEEIFYVGATTASLKSRLYQHVAHGRANKATRGNRAKVAYINALLQAGVEPEILELEKVDTGEASFYEEFYMQLFRSYGFTLSQSPISTFSKAYGKPKVSYKKMGNNPFINRVAAEIKAAREEEGLSQDQLAAKLNMLSSTISRIEAGRQGITVNTVIKIAAALNRRINPNLFEKRT